MKYISYRFQLFELIVVEQNERIKRISMGIDKSKNSRNFSWIIS